jgi:phosphoenolpyruvate synthase/pyruvate phosphate dikinase
VSSTGQQETYLNVHGHAALLESCKRCFASLFTDRAISYRAECGFDHGAIALSIGVQGMVRSDLAMKKVRDEMGLTNVKLMIPFCRTVGEAQRVHAELERNGLRRGERGLEVYVMCEIPSNAMHSVRCDGAAGSPSPGAGCEQRTGEPRTAHHHWVIQRSATAVGAQPTRS